MGNWSYNKHGWWVNWYNNANVKDKPKDAKFVKSFTLTWHEYGLEFSHTWNHSHAIWMTPKNIYWFIFRTSEQFDQKGKWCVKPMKTSNDHISCG